MRKTTFSFVYRKIFLSIDVVLRILKRELGRAKERNGYLFHRDRWNDVQPLSNINFIQLGMTTKLPFKCNSNWAAHLYCADSRYSKWMLNSFGSMLLLFMGKIDLSMCVSARMFVVIYSSFTLHSKKWKCN